jgi:hypothetical protein
MTLLARVYIDLDGYPGAPGLNVLHFSQGSTSSWSDTVVDGLHDEVQRMLEACRFYWAPGVLATIRSYSDIFEHADGQIVDQVSPPTAYPTVVSTGTNGQESRATQALIRFRGDRWVNGRRVQGRMFFGPANGALCDSQGYINEDARATFEDAFVAMTTGVGPRLAVWSRPNPAKNRGGEWTDVTSVTVAPKPAVLRKRRD